MTAASPGASAPDSSGCGTGGHHPDGMRSQEHAPTDRIRARVRDSRPPNYRDRYHLLSVQNDLTRKPELSVATSRNVDIELGELAIAMETQAHGSASMEPVTRPNNRDPLDRRSIGERLVDVSPGDPMLSFDANADAELVCVTANNGLCGVSRHSVVPQRIEAELQAQLLQALETDQTVRLSSTVPGPRTDRGSWAWTATDSDGALFVLVQVHVGTKWFPAAAFAVGNGRKGLLAWEAGWLAGPPDRERWPPPPSWDTDGPLHVPTGRWLILRLFPNVLSFGEEASWLVGFSRCVAWAWLLLGRPPPPNRLCTKTESPLINRWTRAIARSKDASGNAVAVEPRGWRLAASDETADMGETCLAICLWPPNAPRPGEGSPMLLAIRPGPGTGARIDRYPGPSGQSLHSDLADYVERVLVAAAGVYWAERGLLA